MLQILSPYYDIIVFTASQEPYARAVVEAIDKDNHISHCISRDYCIISPQDKLFLKDLRVIKGRNFKDMLLVDNCSHSFSFQISNGVPIIPFYDNPKDQELRKLTEYLLYLKDYKNIAEFNKNYFKFEEFLRYDSFESPSLILKEVYKELS